MSVFLPTSENIFAFVYWVMSLVTVNVPNAPEPLACIRRSGITSRSKWASFSRNHTSCSSSGPRGPAVRLFWLSTTGAPAAVVAGLVLSGTFTGTGCSSGCGGGSRRLDGVQAGGPSRGTADEDQPSMLSGMVQDSAQAGHQPFQ